MTRKIFTVVLFTAICLGGIAQTSDDQYREPLKQVLTEIEKQFGITIRYNEDQVKDLYVTYARWRFRYDAETTLKNVLASQDLSFSKTGDKAYKISPFQYHLKTIEEGKAQLAYLSEKYNDVASWEKRKAELRTCMWEALRLSPLPPTPNSKPIITARRKMDGYTVENIAIEILPGLYTCGSVYRPVKIKGKLPVVLCPDGHWAQHRYRADCQYRCATLARMGCIAMSYDLFAWGESLLQFQPEDHRRSLAMTVQALSSIRILDYLLSLKEADSNRVAISGGSGGASQTMLITALDDRIKLSAPVVMVSSYHSGGCPCESGMPVHLCGGGTNNPEIAAMAAPKPMLVVSDGKDWTQHVPQVEFPFIKRIYGFYGKEGMVENVHLTEEGHDFGINKRKALYAFIAKHFKLKVAGEENITIEKEEAMQVFDGKLPVNAMVGYEQLENLFK